MITKATAAPPILGLKEVEEENRSLPAVCGYSRGKTKKERVRYVRESCELHYLTVGGSRCYDYMFDGDKWFKAWQVGNYNPETENGGGKYE